MPEIALSEMVDELIKLYDTSPEGEGFLRDTPEAEPIREIGKALNRAGGKALMQQAHMIFSQKRSRAARNLDMVWDGIGSWMG